MLVSEVVSVSEFMTLSKSMSESVSEVLKNLVSVSEVPKNLVPVSESASATDSDTNSSLNCTFL